ncbi:MAG: hypothetical protein QOG15_1370 [Solirubrobacteraceae bacterium]|jgi:hypothetical protein|nr:hypothetical protein [Solirubrobacteraceae bacterium]
MVSRLRTVAWGGVLALALVVVSCGGPSQAQTRDRRAAFVRDADEVCDAAFAKLAGGSQPRSYEALRDRMNRDAAALTSSGKDLHHLRDKLGDSASPQISAFDDRLDAVPTATARISQDAELHDAGATRHSARRLREAYDALYRAAGKATLRRCGRGGNRAADLALFTVYRDEYVTVHADAILRLERRQGGVQNFDAFHRYLRSGLRVFANYRRRLARLAPPKVLRHSHRLLLRRSTRALRTGHRLLALLDRGQIAAINGGGRALLLALIHQANRSDAAEASIRRILGFPRGHRSSPPPQGTDAA